MSTRFAGQLDENVGFNWPLAAGLFDVMCFFCMPR